MCVECECGVLRQLDADGTRSGIDVPVALLPTVNTHSTASGLYTQRANHAMQFATTGAHCDDDVSGRHLRQANAAAA